jgi:hypothetical protein
MPLAECNRFTECWLSDCRKPTFATFCTSLYLFKNHLSILNLYVLYQNKKILFINKNILWSDLTLFCLFLKISFSDFPWSIYLFTPSLNITIRCQLHLVDSYHFSNCLPLLQWFTKLHIMPLLAQLQMNVLYMSMKKKKLRYMFSEKLKDKHLWVIKVYAID